MGIKYRQEDEADKWLREHDPYYTDSRKNKRKKVSHPYDTPEQEHRRSQIEIPISNLNGAQKRKLKEVAGAYDEDGNFEL
jgi:hypothetical protein